MPTPAPAVVIRSARPEDASPITTLLAELGYPDNDRDSVERRLADWTDEPRGRVLVAQAGDSVVGVAAVVALPYLERPGRFARLVALVVSDGRRGLGIGRRLVDAAEAQARDYGCDKVEVTSSQRRDGAHAFYHRLGYQDAIEQSKRFVKPL